ncbi:ribonuclease J [Lactobacillus kefiranofaciens]|uniref:Ribonuclease J n=1 Tax=Lactobacillus kefiranofaciens TaxID=267818 RepID=A0AAX3UF09_9LACO|nr:ribonuclease J [Lactobacillus kefiranofaciens]AEG40502.1 Metallo-beta-lactamase superfamily hydrolase [Lactobacillus kefiranofaciens subsp. kefiranofaciens]KRM22523.1 metallo-beta-lactamase superfamily hydrolase [Lactobacillus kefiranofaciens subsp. kefiranofaciens DSM 5016 = JCM 6985]QFQ68030.1 ribonuclease J [Lactobacillus kefiranofaciens subsp. kefiranofaciens]WGO86194.1 ribonuclease J [Lactobacillus kefiranofaciens]WQH36487.1 ribonuclease J [Lactobacillus kefiranofaciens]
MANQLKIMILSGVREQGKDMFAVQVNDEIFVLDAGLKYPDSSLFGIDVVIPDLDFFEQYGDRVAGIFLTHGHADSIGALPYILRKYDIPVFGSQLSIELAKIEVQRENKHRKNNLFHVIDADTEIDFKNASISFFHTTHSIPDSLGIDVHTPEGEVVYTGDFKFDPTAEPNYRTDMDRLAEIEQKDVLALLSDSSNAEASFPNASEQDIGNFVTNAFRNATGRIIVAAKASNLNRVQEVLNAAKATGKRVLLTGRDLAKIVRTSMKLGYLDVPEGLLMRVKDLKTVPKEQTVILETGRMGEPLNSLQKMAKKRHSMITIHKGDLIFLATTPSHAVETMVAETSDLVYKAGGTVIQLGRNMHTSGHATGRDLQLLIDTLKPKFLIPVIGEYRLLEIVRSLAIKAGMNSKDIYITKNGDCLDYDFKKKRFYLSDPVPGEDTMIDGSGVGDVGSIVLRDREVLSDDGIFIAVVTIDHKKKKIIAEPKVTSRGFVYIKANHQLMKDSIDVIKKAINNNFEHKKFDWTELKQDIWSDLEKFLYKKTNQRPVILPVVMEVNQNRHRAMQKRNEKSQSDKTRKNNRNEKKKKE